MPNRKEHLAIGLLVAIAVLLLLVWYRRQEPEPAEILGAGTGVMVGAVAPDVIEPAITPNHRRAAHSLAALTGAVKLGAAPPTGLIEWRRALRETVEETRRNRKALPSRHSDRMSLWIREQGLLLGAGFTIGFPLGYASHLFADGWSGRLPLLG